MRLLELSPHAKVWQDVELKREHRIFELIVLKFSILDNNYG